MSTNVYQNEPEPRPTVRLPSKPNKLPPPAPPPPLPPKNSSPSQSTISLTRRSTGAYSYAGGGGSEYGDSMYSQTFSTRSLQPSMNTLSPNISQYRSSHSVCSQDMHNHVHSIHQCCSNTPTTCSPCHLPISSCYTRNCQQPNCHTRAHSPASSYHSCRQAICSPYPETINNVMAQRNMNTPILHQHPHTSQCTSGYPSSIGQMSPDIVDTGKITPQIAPRIPRKDLLQDNRPRALISPLPDLKQNTSGHHRESRYHEKCSSFFYRRHIETHIERLLKYLKEREERFRLYEKSIKERTKIAHTISDLFVKQESRYLRNFRARLGPNDFKFIRSLGAGYYGEVSLVRKKPKEDEKPPGQLFAMKRLSKDRIRKLGQIAHVMAERDILAESDNEWIVKLIYSFQDCLFLYFILEYIPGGDLMSLLQREEYLSEEVARFYITEISMALHYVHRMNFIHRDIKPDNILIDAKGHIKLTDFGLCTGFRWTHDMEYYIDDNFMVNNNNNNNNKFKSSARTYDDSNLIENDCPTITRGLTKRHQEHSMKRKTLSNVGSLNYTAPEVLLNEVQHGVNERLSDWWSVGVILYEMVYGYTPFINLELVKNRTWHPDLDPNDAIQHRIKNFTEYLYVPDMNDAGDGGLLMTKHPISQETRSLIKQFLCHSRDRICQNGIDDLKQHPFFAGVDWNNIRNTQAPLVPDLKSDDDTKYFPEIEVPLWVYETEHPKETSTSATMEINDFTYRDYWEDKRRFNIDDQHEENILS